MTKTNKQLQALQKSSQAKRDNTILKVNTVLRAMQEKSLPINFGSVSKLAGVSKTWLYAQPEIKDQIAKARVKSGVINRVIDQQANINKKEAEVRLLKEKN